MELISLHAKKIMEGCKERAREVGLTFSDETLEYIVTNRDLLELSPKVMIPTLYDYWVHDVEVLREKGRYELYPGNPYETVINTRPPISFYNDNNPDWLNVMIFYHVLGHVDFFQNNAFFRNTWDYDFLGRALSDKRVIAKLRAENGRWVDYIIEFTRGIDNLVGYFGELARLDSPEPERGRKMLDYYFDIFLQSVKKTRISDYIKEVDRYNTFQKQYGARGEEAFFVEVKKEHPEFEAFLEKHLKMKPVQRMDLIEYLMQNAAFLKKEENRWMKSVMNVVRNTSLFFAPQIRTKIMNEGWASFWHEILFMQDDRIKGHEVDFARVNAGVTAMPRVGLNPYALGLRLFYHIKDLADKGKLSHAFQQISNVRQREAFDTGARKGQDMLLWIRENLCDFMFINTFVDQDFMTHNNLFVAGTRLNEKKMVWEYFIKSKKAADYREMLKDSLYHPPAITVDPEKTKEGHLYLVHQFEGKPLVSEYIPNTMLGVEFLWGGPVSLETTEVASVGPSAVSALDSAPGSAPAVGVKPEVNWQRVIYTMQDRKLTKEIL
ncbi:MAG: SpoVR family protein [Desulfobacterales bacterium CG07_land_8_20_14_0_80_52_14]|nr:MAG: SpoVR family protein [Desulfobacterales bacterium CG23_combo_of_CG06-09_8_20_14_all_52_9]PIU49864.1 MAG: SpoVR family protein [Desulfobacterales bacterium CG07_land_8_20_14_0_80_52_14]